LIVGINAYHGDSSTALFKDGRCISAIEQERFSRLKHHAGFPNLAIQGCLEVVGAEAQDIRHVAIGRDPSAHLHKKVLFSLKRVSSMKEMLRARLANAAKVLDTRDAVARALQVDPNLIGAKVHRVEHHRAHLASAFFCSPFEEAACLSIDGMGDFVSTMWGGGTGSKVDVEGQVLYPNSLGVFYTALTQFIGLPSYGDEYKLMGLSAYGEPRFLEQMREVVRLNEGLEIELNLDYFIHDKEGVDMTWEEGTPEIGPLWSKKMEDDFGPARKFRGDVTSRDEDLAASVQARLEEIVLEMLRRLHKQTGEKRLVMAGGVALNCVVNGMIRSETPFEEVWIQPAANDAGISIGAALWVQHQVLGQERSWVMDHAFLGPEFSETDYKIALEDLGVPYVWLDDDRLMEETATRISEGKIVGWFQGKMEFGPRALGNRSIICDPRRRDMKDILNSRIKYREPFRPFAPSILGDKTGEWFTQDYPSPFMLMAYQVRQEKRDQIPAVTHEDGTGRLQTVDPATNQRYHALISAFERQTGVPVVLNTSFNENEPICCKPDEAIDCFKRTQMDTLVLGNFLVDKPNSNG
jgi:carbamoyltransferase